MVKRSKIVRIALGKSKSTPPMLWRMCECRLCGRMLALRRGLLCKECSEQ